MKSSVPFWLAVVLSTARVTGLASTAAAAETHAAKVPIESARATALGRVPGVIVAEELEHEHGIWIYSFEIRPKGEKRKLIKEVNVDADTGAVVSVATENE
jgi:uncharacterized membrane protein YkoI